MIRSHKYYTKPIKAALRPKTLIPALINQTGWLTCPIGRRVLHQELHNAATRQALDATVIHPIQKQALLKSIQKLATLAPGGAVGVKNVLSSLTTYDWLDIERNLINALLHHPKSVTMPTETLLQAFNLPVQAPKFIKKYVENTYDSHAVGAMGLAPVFMLIAGSLGVLNDHVIVDNIMKAAAVIATTFCPSVIMSGCAYNAKTQALEGNGRLRNIASVSPSWDEVLQSRNMEDAILLGMLSTFYSNVTVEDWEQHRVPNFLVMAPSAVYELLSRLLDDEGEHCVRQYQEVLAVTAGYAASTQNQPNESQYITSTVAGYDLSSLLPTQPLVTTPMHQPA